MDRANLKQDQADTLKARWLEQHRRQAPIDRGPERDDSFHPLAWSPVDMAAVEFAQLSVAQVALMFGLPSYILGAASDSSTSANVESRMTEFYSLTLLPWIGRAEAVLDRAATTDRSDDRGSGPAQSGPETRYDSYTVALSNGILTVRRNPADSKTVRLCLTSREAFCND